MRDADSVLQAYLHSTDETEQKWLESELLQTHAAPLVRRALRQRLGFYVDQSCSGSNHTDAADLYQEAMLRLLQKLSELRSRRDANGINDFGNYVVRIAVNTCNEYLRDKAPERSSLNHNLRDLLTRHRDFGVWKGENNSLLCGFAAWKKRRTDAVQTITPERSDEIIQSLRRSGLIRQDLQRFPTGKILSEIFEQVGGPIEFDCLAEMVAAALMIKDLPPESLDQNEDGLGLELIDVGPTPDAQIEGREMLQLMWEELRRMPAIQRDIVCFKFSDHSGEDFFNLITRAGIATLKELTEEFGLTPEQLAEICKRTPMDIEDLARHFGVSRQQVSKLHHRAIIRLLDRLTKK
jgi:RNA polymerase sigma factor (sigma-70 family)